jgi:hypothetical protein
MYVLFGFHTLNEYRKDIIVNCEKLNGEYRYLHLMTLCIMHTHTHTHTHQYKYYLV